MSGGLMSCVRENSPPLDMDVNVSGPLSLPEPCINNSDLMGSIHSSSHHNIISSTPLAAQQSSTHAENEGSTGLASTATPPSTEQTKRRRFHPLRNLRRIFRRRTITSATSAAGDTSVTALTGNTASSNSEKNLRSATLSSITSVASASSPSSPLTHQQLQDAYLTQSLPKSKSAYISLLGGGKKHQNHEFNVNSETKAKSKYKNKNQKHQQQQSKEYDIERHQQLQEAEDMFGTTTQTSATYHHHHTSSSLATVVPAGTSAASKSSLLSQRQSMGVAVFPGAINRSFFTERQKLRSVGDSSQDLDSGSGNDSGTGGGHNSLAMQCAKNGSSASGGEMSDSQRSLSEGRLVDSDYSRDGLSQSHDSVFSESATASSLSIVLKAELADVLRKRRNRPDASDEDLGLPRSPASPQRRATSSQHNGTTAASQLASKQLNLGEKQNEISSLSMLSMISNDGDDFLTTSETTQNTSITAAETVQERVTATKFSRPSTMSSVSMSSDILRHPDASFDDNRDEVDLFSSDWQRLSHTAAKHKMAIRPIKKRGGPSRQHRRTLETSIPEANEDFNKIINKNIVEVKDFDTQAKTRSLPPGVNAALLTDELLTAAKEPITKTTKINSLNTTLTTNTCNTIASAANNMFGLRNLTAKASAIFESKDTQQHEEVTNKSVSPKKVEVADKTSQPTETIETGFLRRLMHRNSKRSIAKVNAEYEDQNELDKKQNEPKKKQISCTSLTYSSSAYEKSKTEFGTLDNYLEENHREMKIETSQEGKKAGQTVIVNNFALPAKDERKLEDKSPTKPKSGPAARQRYLPQNISNEDLVKINEERTEYKECKLPQSINEAFQSTSLVREISRQQYSKSISPAKIEHHFEKKPKIVGLSAFQQKVSRSNDSFGRISANASLLSLDKPDNLSSTVHLQTYEQKQRKSVEKSRSFKAYGEQNDMPSSASMHNNMPSLPDLSLSLRVPYYKEFVSNGKDLSEEKYISLSAEVNGNKLVKPDQESQKSLSSNDKNISIPNRNNCTEAIKAIKLLTPTCNKNISEVENNTDLMAKSPCVNVLRKSINLSEEQSDEVIKASPTPPAEKVRPTALSLRKEKSLSDENILNSPSTAAVMMREKTVVKTNALYSSTMSSPINEVERKSAPALNGKNMNGFRCNSTRRSSSIMESAEKPSRSNVPEFMKIQLNRVDPTRSSKGHVVLAKNIKEISTSFSRECSPEKNYCSSSMDDLSFRRLSSESVDIHERTSPPNEKSFSGPFHEAINKQAKICTGLPPRSPVKKTPTTPTTPPTPTINDRDTGREYCRFPDTLDNPSNTNSLSLQERRRLFMNEERNKIDKKMEEIRFERKKSLSEEVTRKYASRSESEQKEMSSKDLSPSDNAVILRKKSFASSVHSLNGNSFNSSNCSSNNNISTNKDDSTPELMKVFARRSLKIKDEDLDKMLSSNVNSNLSAVQTLKKFANPCSNPSLDSDKENQSASDEKLDKLPLLETNQTMNNVKNNNTQINTAQITLNGSVSANNNNNNRNSLADFRLGSSKISHSALAINNINNNNNNGTSNGESCSLSGGKTTLPPIKVNGGGLRPISIERNNNQNNALTPTKVSTTLERSINKLGDHGASSLTDGPTNLSKTMERSATMGEFKGIHQRRAEWEQRAKEALK